MQKLGVSALPTFHSNSGIDSISRHSAIHRISLVDADLQPARDSDRPRLAQLYPLTSYEDFIWEQLAPTFSCDEVMMPARFRSSLSMLQSRMRSLIRQRNGSSKRFGRLAQLLDKQDELSKLALMYFSALLQG